MMPISNMIILDEEDKDRLRGLAKRLGANVSPHRHMHSGKAYPMIDSKHTMTTISIDTWFVDMMENLVNKLDELRRRQYAHCNHTEVRG